jgi:ABC-type nitrate/sulfonate/bicarbonate transport system permease component
MVQPVDTPDPRALPSIAEEGRRRLFGFARSVAIALAFAAAAIVLWHAAVVGFAIPHFVMPTPGAAWQAFHDNRPEIGGALAYTLRSAAIGLALATAIALSLAAMFVASDTATRAILPIVIGLRTAPVLAIAPILILIFGRGVGTSIVVVVIVAFFPIMVNAMRGFRAARRSTLELMHVCGASGVQTFLKVRFPFALPYIFTGLRAASASAILSAMLAEWLSGAPGLGTLILDAASYRDLGLLWAAVVVSMIMAFSIFALTAGAERRLLTWSR